MIKVIKNISLNTVNENLIQLGILWFSASIIFKLCNWLL